MAAPGSALPKRVTEGRGNPRWKRRGKLWNKRDDGEEDGMKWATRVPRATHSWHREQCDGRGCGAGARLLHGDLAEGDLGDRDEPLDHRRPLRRRPAAHGRPRRGVGRRWGQDPWGMWLGGCSLPAGGGGPRQGVTRNSFGAHGLPHHCRPHLARIQNSRLGRVGVNGVWNAPPTRTPDPWPVAWMQ